MTQELRKLAEAANQDSPEWKWDGRKVDSDGYVHIPECSYLVGNICLADTYEGYQDHCEFIAAANPSAILALLDELDAARKDAAVAIGMLADWCVAVDQNGTGWDDWDEHYKDAMYRPCPIREQLDAAIDAAMEASK